MEETEEEEDPVMMEEDHEALREEEREDHLHETRKTQDLADQGQEAISDEEAEVVMKTRTEDHDQEAIEEETDMSLENQEAAEDPGPDPEEKKITMARKQELIPYRTNC